MSSDTDCFLENNRYESCLEQQQRDLRRPVHLRHEEDFSTSRPRLELGYQKETLRNVGNGTLTMKKDITKRLLIEYNIDDITKIEPSMGSQGKAWVFNVMSGESDDDDDEIVYVVFDVSLEYCENF